MSHSHPSPIFGAAFLGVNFTGPDETDNLLLFLESKGIKRSDTARRYPAVNEGESERLLGKHEAAKKGFVIETKVRPTAKGLSNREAAVRGGRGSLTAPAIEESVRESLEALCVEKVGRSGCLTVGVVDGGVLLGRLAAVPRTG